MKRFGLFMFLLVMTVVAVEPALANKFTTIGSGVGGVSREKVMMLQKISLYAGVFFAFLGSVALMGRRRFEGFVVTYTGKRFEMATAGPAFFIVFGGFLAGLSFL